jgi:GDP-mannose 4,6-dehydratase
MKNVLITGITGFVGSHLAEYTIKNYPDIKVGGLVRWRSSNRNIEQIVDKVELYYGDLTDLASLFEILSKNRPYIIFHLAAQSYVNFSSAVPAATLQSNVIGTCNLLEAVKELKIRTGYDPVVHICSSSEVYGQVKEDEVPIKETQPLRPASLYAVSKVGEDMLGFQYWLSFGIRTIRTRMFTHTGPRRGEVFATSNFAKQIVEIEVGKREPVIKVGNLDSIRTFMDVRDAVRAYWLAVTKCQAGEVYNIGGKETMSIGDMLYKLIRMSTKRNITVELEQSRFRPSDVTRQIPCIEKFVDATGWSPEIPFDKTLEDLLNYWRENIK